MDKKYLKYCSCLILPLVILLASEIISRSSFSYIFNSNNFSLRMLAGYAADYLLITFIMICIWGFSNNLAVPFACTYYFVYFISCISYFKLAVRGEQLYLSDVVYSLKIAGVAGSSNIIVNGYIIIGLLLGIAVTVFLAVFIKPVKVSYKHRFPCLAITICFLFMLNASNYFIPKNSFQRNPVFLTQFFINSPSFNKSKNRYVFDYNTKKYNKEYLDTQIEDIKSNIVSNDATDMKPDVVVILSESFWDISKLPGIELSRDPLKYFRSLAAGSVSGNLISITYGGGTAMVEYEILTGMLDRLVITKETAFESYLTEPVMSLASIFKSKGYDTLGLHTSGKDFYNRKNTYPLLGFDKFIGIEDMDHPVKNGLYTGDAYFTDQIINALDNHSEPLFMFAISMENHQPYNANRYSENTVKILNSDMPSDLKNNVESYLEGISHSDQELKRLTDYLSERDRPCVLLFFGDHQPSLGAEFGLYRYANELRDTNNKTAEDYHKLLTVPFLIWSNYKDVTEFSGDVGSNFLGNVLLNYIGTEKPLFYHHLDTIYEHIRFFGRSELTIDSNEELYDSMPDENKQYAETFALFQYDILLGKGYVKDALGEMR